MRFCILTSLFLVLLTDRHAVAQTPEINHIHEIFLTGENFDATTEVWQWAPPEKESGTLEELVERFGKPAEIPNEIPAGASRVLVRDMEPQVLVADLANDWERFSTQWIWVKNEQGISAPYRIGAPKPFWLSRTELSPGDAIHLFGQNLGARNRSQRFVLVNESTALEMPPRKDPAQVLSPDPHLLFFAIPEEAKPGKFEVWIHNGTGGAYGWSSAGEVTVIPKVSEEPKIFRAADTGALGDGENNDTAAIREALQKAADAGGGIVLLPPGTYLVDETVVVPAGVTLRGAARENTVVRGIGYTPQSGRHRWFSTDDGPASVIVLQENTGLEMLTITGAVGSGIGGRALVQGYPSQPTYPAGGTLHNVQIVECTLFSPAVDEEHGTMLYRGGEAVFFDTDTLHVSLLKNVIHGGVVFGQHRKAERVEVKRNTIHGGQVYGHFYDSLLDSNILKDTPGRFIFNGHRHSYARFNESHYYSRGAWGNIPESFLVHGGYPKTTSSPTSVGKDSLTDSRQRWAPGQHLDHTVLITAGRGFGQFRRVVENTSDTLLLDEPWRVEPDETSEYVVGIFFVESAFYENLNNGIGVTTLWLDCIGIRVIRQRDFNGAGLTIWGRDPSTLNEDGAVELARFSPSWYNTIANNWFDQSGRVQLFCGNTKNPAYRGPALFANSVFQNQIRGAHLRRTNRNTNHRVPVAKGAIEISGGSSHTRVEGNFITFTNIGINIFDKTLAPRPEEVHPAHKTIVVGNQFQEVETPIIDNGQGTLLSGNFEIQVSEEGTQEVPIADQKGDVDPIERTRRYKLAEVSSDKGADKAFNFFDYRLETFLSNQSYNRSDVASEEKQEECAENLRQLYDQLVRFEKESGKLPDAAFFPENPLAGDDSLAVILGEPAKPFLICPTAGPELTAFGWLSYLWNEEVGGKSLKEIAQPEKTWLLMDFAAGHPFLVDKEQIGHQGGVNVLYADGTVRWIPAAEIPLQRR